MPDAVFHTILDHTDRYAPFLDRFQTVLTSMDRQYGSVASDYGFECKGCKDSCCLTLFYHHTLLECLYLYIGFRKLDRDTRHRIIQRAIDVHDHHRSAIGTGRSTRKMCPLNVDNRCLIYDYRPMICRLHGIPYELHTAAPDSYRGPGCDNFYRHCSAIPYVPFDRTPLYAAVAELEKELLTQLLKLQ